MYFFLFFALIMALALVLFAVQNSAVVTLTFIVWTFEGPLAFILALIFAAGLIAGICLCLPAIWRKLVESKACRKRIKELEKGMPGVTEEQAAGEDV